MQDKTMRTDRCPFVILTWSVLGKIDRDIPIGAIAPKVHDYKADLPCASDSEHECMRASSEELHRLDMVRGVMGVTDAEWKELYAEARSQSVPVITFLRNAIFENGRRWNIQQPPTATALNSETYMVLPPLADTGEDA